MSRKIDGIRFTADLEGIDSRHLRGFFTDWPDPPSPATHLGLLAGSQGRLLAVDEESGRVVGFITVLTDGVLIAYISLLEVLPNYQDRGIGTALVEKMLAQLDDLYAVDLLCDEQMVSFYEKFGLKQAVGMAIRRYDRQSGTRGRGGMKGKWIEDQGE